jgi:hypothetical protein
MERSDMMRFRFPIICTGTLLSPCILKRVNPQNDALGRKRQLVSHSQIVIVTRKHNSLSPPPANFDVVIKGEKIRVI